MRPGEHSSRNATRGTPKGTPKGISRGSSNSTSPRLNSSNKSSQVSQVRRRPDEPALNSFVSVDDSGLMQVNEIASDDDYSGEKEDNDYGYSRNEASKDDGSTISVHRPNGNQASNSNHSTSGADEDDDDEVDSGDRAIARASTGSRAPQGKGLGTAIESKLAPPRAPASRLRPQNSLDHSPSPSPPPPHSLQKKLASSNARNVRHAQKPLLSSSSFSSAASAASSTASSVMHSVLPSMSSSPLMKASTSRHHHARGGGGDSDAILQLADEEIDAHAPSGLTFSFDDLFSEVTSSSTFSRIQDRDKDASYSWGDILAYRLENAIAANSNVRFYVLIFVFVVGVVSTAVAWALLYRYNDVDDEREDTANVWGAIFLMFQMWLTGGFEIGIDDVWQRAVFAVTVLGGLVLTSVLIGLITDMVNVYMVALSAGTSKVVDSGHTLILGWNESTTRVICQLAFLRRVFIVSNSTGIRRWLPWKRLPPSSPVARSVIVCMNDTMDKATMETLIVSAFKERNISPERTKIGRDVVFRRGDPTQSHDLVRVAAFSATSILVMMTEKDRQENAVSNSATIRTALSLRNVIYSNGDAQHTFDPHLRIVVQLSEYCAFMQAAAVVSPQGRSCLFPQDLSKAINTLLFVCAAKPGLSRVLMNLYNFEGVAIRCREAKQLRGGKHGRTGWFVGKTMREAILDCHWHAAVVIGLADDTYGVSSTNGQVTGDDEVDDYGSGRGICCDPDTVIASTDFVIFVSAKSMPSCRQPSFREKDYAAEAEAYLEGISTNIVQFAKDNTPKHFLIMGWRSEWDDEPERFRGRIIDVSAGLSKGSSITCVNKKPRADFGTLLETCGRSKWQRVEAPEPHTKSLRDRRSGLQTNANLGWTLGDHGSGVIVKHFCADPVEYNEVKVLMRAQSFDSAICLGSVVGEDLDAASRDSRVLTMLLILRSLVSPTKPMHIIAENYQDQTASLAIVPRASAPKSKIKSNQASINTEPDFINTQAIVARCLVMNLAYPQIQDALSELLESSELSSDVMFFSAASLGIEGYEVSFGAVLHMLMTTFGGYAVAIGYFHGVNMVLAPDPAEDVHWTEGHRLVALVREAGPRLELEQAVRQQQREAQEAVDISASL